MSHFTTINTQMVSESHLVEALRELGFSEVEVHEEPENLYGYQGDVRPQKANVIIRREHVGRASNDIGFARNDDGVFQAFISEYDRSRYDEKWLQRLTQRYAYHVTKDRLEEQDFTMVDEEVEEDETIHITVRRMV